ncbi:MAG TPA: ArsA-related P-loop ATPase [Acidimicrobiia bacterium]|nr:ArsA-related P-loop ATPase [Acidimicrobiia bacterium]
MTTRAIVVTGAGGVGKTTVAAAIAISHARSGRRTLVLTVDPARRLADALGLELGSEPIQVPAESLLWGAMIDAAGSWQAVARKHADPAVAERLVTSEFFQAATVHFPASQSYAAAEEATNYLDSGHWDVVVVDTPPAAGGIDFFSAPSQMTDLVGGRLLRLITGGRLPGRKLLFNRGARPLLRFADQILGSDLLERVAQFLMDLRTTYDGVRRRAQVIEAHFRKATTLIVTTADPAPLAEAGRFFRELPEVAASPTLVVFNRSLPLRWATTPVPPRTNVALTENLHRWGAEAQRQADARLEFSSRYPIPLATIPWQAQAPTDVEALGRLFEEAENWPEEI